jgi:hypothetical protein
MNVKTLLLSLFFLSVFLHGIAQNQIVEAEYYLDQDPGFGNAIPIDLTSAETVSEAFTTSTGDLNAGRYFAYVRVKDENNMWSIPLKVPFQIQKSDLPDITDAEWYIGEDPGFGSGNSIELNPGEIVNGLLSASTEDLPAGRHFAFIRFQNADGSWSIPLKQAFVINDKFPLDVVAAEYFIDEDPGFGLANPVSVDPDHFISESYLAELSTDLEIGDHFLYTRVQNEEDFWSVNLVRTFSVGTVSTEDEELLQSIKVFPNPSRGPISILSENLSVESVQIFNAQGRLIDQYQNRFERLEIDGLARGTYLFRIATEKGSLTKAIVIQ